MRRTAFTLSAGLLLAAFAAGQGPAPGATAGERYDRYARNQGLVTDLVSRGVEMANMTNHVSRAEACHGTARDLARNLKAAEAAEDAGRAVELAEYLDSVVRVALAPALNEARDNTPKGSPEADRIIELRKTAKVDVAAWADGLSTGKLAKSARAAAAKKQLAAAAAGLE